MVISCLELLASDPQQAEHTHSKRDSPRFVDKALPVMADEGDDEDHDGFAAQDGDHKGRKGYCAQACDNINDK